MYSFALPNQEIRNIPLKLKTSYGHAIALWKKREIDQKRLII